jgi:hypothetical protein
LHEPSLLALAGIFSAGTLVEPLLVAPPEDGALLDPLPPLDELEVEGAPPATLGPRHTQ